MELEVLKVGTPFKDFIGLEEGISLNATENGLRLLITFRNIHPMEVEHIAGSGYTECKALVKNNLLMFFIKFGDMDWWETSLRVREDTVLDPITSDDVGHAMHIILAEAGSGIVYGLRMIGLGNKFSKDFDKMFTQVTPLSTEDFISAVDTVHRAYSVKELLKMTNTRYTVGVRGV